METSVIAGRFARIVCSRDPSNTLGSETSVKARRVASTDKLHYGTGSTEKTALNLRNSILLPCRVKPGQVPGLKNDLPDRVSGH